MIIPLLIILLLLPMRMSSATIQHFSWINATTGTDPLYDQTVVAYQSGTWWNISISLINDYLTPPPPPRINLPINVTSIKAYFDWGKWYNYTFSPSIRMEPFEVKVFNVGNVTPPTTEAPETWVHSYTIYVEYIPEGDTTPLTDWYTFGTNFAVMSQDHFTAFQLYNKLSMFVIDGIPVEFSNVTEAQVLMAKAFMEMTLGRQAYDAGLFTNASTHLKNADQYITDAFDAWETQGTALENAQLDYLDALGYATRKQGDADYMQGSAALNNSYGWIFFGLGWVLIGIGIMFYGIRKPKAATAATSPPS